MDEDEDDLMSGTEAPDQSPAAGGGGPPGSKTALKRGDACLACRRRRIRCSAEKPVCATCARLKKTCVYESGKSTSRIAVLKSRIAELEEQLRSSSATAEPIARLSQGHHGQALAQTQAHTHNHTQTQTQAQAGSNHDLGLGHTINPSSLGFGLDDPFAQLGHVVPTPDLTSASGSGSVNGSAGASNGVTPASMAVPPVPFTFDASLNHTLNHALADQSFGVPLSSFASSPSRLPYAQSTNPRPYAPPAPDAQFEFDLSFLDTPVADISQSVFLSTLNKPADGTQLVERFNQVERFSQYEMGKVNGVRGDEDDDDDGEETIISCGGLGFKRNRAGKSRGDDGSGDIEGERDGDGDYFGEIAILPSLPQGRDVVGGWFDPNDVPPPVRDHLLDLFFSRTGVFGIVFHMPRFYARLTLPPSKRPHPGLLYAMYVTAARQSSQPAIKQLESQFYEIANKQIQLAVAHHDRLLDIVRGMALLTNYLFAKEKYSLGYHMVGSAVRLAISCGLDRIPSSVWSPPPPFNVVIHCTLRTGGYAIPPPEDPIDLAERIYTFWAVFETDLCTAVAYLWHTGLPIEEITTPFPRPLIEYELGLVSTQDDISIGSVLNPTPLSRSADNSFLVLRMKALTLLARVLRLRQERSEVDSSLHAGASAGVGGAGYTEPQGAGQSPHVGGYPGSARPAFVTHPSGFAQIKQALDHYCDSLPEQRKLPWRWDEGTDLALPRVSIPKETAVLQFLIGDAYMQLWNVRALDADNTVAILVARRLVNIMYLFQTEPLSSGYDIFIITIWNEVAMVLLREAKRLRCIGASEEQVRIMESDLDVAITALKKWGDVNISNEHDGADIAAINGKMLDQLKGMAREDWQIAMSESRRRFGSG